MKAVAMQRSPEGYYAARILCDIIPVLGECGEGPENFNAVSNELNASRKENVKGTLVLNQH